MTFELMVKVIANGLFFTPKAVVKDVGDIMTFFIYFVGLPSGHQFREALQMFIDSYSLHSSRICSFLSVSRGV